MSETTNTDVARDLATKARGIGEDLIDLGDKLDELAENIDALTNERDTLQAELHRCRTTETASAHALDVVRQHHDLPLIPGEHPSDTAKRLTAR